MLHEKCTGPFVTSLADSAFPISVRPEQATMITDPVLKNLLKGIQVSVDKVGLEIPPGKENAPQIGVKVSMKKDGERDALSIAGKASFDIAMKCGKEHNVVRVTPSLLDLAISSIPSWLLKSTVVNLGNATVGKWQALCVYGDCKSKQHIDVSLPFQLPKGAAPKGPAKPCSFETFVAEDK
jgi:hypothetical protein